MTQPIHCLQTKRHKLSLCLAKNTFKRHLLAKGHLVGQFYQYVPIKSQQQVTFSGDFAGFFQPDFEGDLYSLSYFFEGRIDNLCVVEIEEDEHSETSKLMDENMFIGYFRGVFEQREIYSQREAGPAAFKHDIRKELQLLGIFEQSKHYELILPTFTRFLVKNLTAINLEKSLAEIIGTMTIEIQVLPELFDIFRYEKNSKEVLVIALNKENSLALPLEEGTIISSNSQITCSFNEEACLVTYVIRKNFETEIDNSYGQFFSPFSLTYLNIVMTFLELELHNPFVQNEYLSINFLNLDLDDKLDNNPYTSSNELFSQLDRNERLKNRMTKIDLFNSIESGQYIISTNYLTLFSYHSRTFENSNRKRSSRRWTLAIANKNKYLKEPTVTSIKEAYRSLQQTQAESGKRDSPIHLFHFSYWKHIHIEIPVYKYWVLNVIQIFVPIFILSSLSLFVFIQENGVKVDGSSTLNARIINVAAILLAYVALIPMIKENAPRATNLSFIYLVIYLSIIPHILALLSSLRDRRMLNTDWEEQYHPFKDPLFVGSFLLLCFLIASVLIVVFAFVRFSYSDYQIQLKPKSIPHKEFSSADEPWGLRSYISRLKEKRKEQFNFNRADSLEQLGFSMDSLG